MTNLFCVWLQIILEMEFTCSHYINAMNSSVSHWWRECRVRNGSVMLGISRIRILTEERRERKKK